MDIRSSSGDTATNPRYDLLSQQQCHRAASKERNRRQLGLSVCLSVLCLSVCLSLVLTACSLSTQSAHDFGVYFNVVAQGLESQKKNSENSLKRGAESVEGFRNWKGRRPMKEHRNPTKRGPGKRLASTF